MVRCLLVVVVALLALQASTALSLPSLSDLFNEAKDETKKAISQAQSTITDLEDKVVKAAEEESSKIQKEVQSIVSQVQSQIDATVQKFEQAGKTAIACTEAVPTQLLELSENITKSAVGCVTSKVEEAKGIITDLIAQVEKANDTFAGLQPSLAACQKDIFTALGCSIKVLDNAVTSGASVVSSVASDIVKADTLITTFPTSVSTCETNTFTAVPDEAATLVKNVEACYKGVFPSA